jgi:hypothetical protein
MRHQHYRSTLIQNGIKCRQCGPDPGIIGNAKLIIQGNIKVHTDENALSTEIELLKIDHDKAVEL